jgi:hypothetical protein
VIPVPEVLGQARTSPVLLFSILTEAPEISSPVILKPASTTVGPSNHRMDPAVVVIVFGAVVKT